MVQLDSDVGDYIGAGRSYTYSQANALIDVTIVDGYFAIQIDGDQLWGGAFETPQSINALRPGTYTGLTRLPFHDPATGGLSWSGEGRGCNTLTGSFTIDSVRTDGDSVTAIALRFEQHCEGAVPALRGSIVWSADDPTQPPGPLQPPPAALWQPAPGATPPTGDYVYLNSDPGDFIGSGFTYTYTPATDTILVTSDSNNVTVSVAGWLGRFQAMNAVGQVQPGYYPDLRRFPFHNPTKGGLDWHGQGRGCNRLLGWFVVDRVTYSNGVVTGLSLRFEQHCEEGVPALRGAVRWG